MAGIIWDSEYKMPISLFRAIRRELRIKWWLVTKWGVYSVAGPTAWEQAHGLASEGHACMLKYYGFNLVVGDKQ